MIAYPAFRKVRPASNKVKQIMGFSSIRQLSISSADDKLQCSLNSEEKLLLKIRSTAAAFKEQDSVEWNSPHGAVQGVVLKKGTEPTRIKGHTTMAPPERPKCLAQSSWTGELSIHRPEALRNI